MAKKTRADRRSKRKSIGAFLNYVVSSSRKKGNGPRKPLILRRKKKKRTLFPTATHS